MKIGSGWTKNSEITKNTYISITLEDIVQDFFPTLKDYNITLNYITYNERERKENSPSWNVNIYKKKQAKENTENNEEFDSF